MHTIIINGTGGVGKDTLITEFDKITKLKTHRVSIIDMVKRAAEILGWKNTKTDENRKALSELKDFSDKYWGSPIDYVMSNYEDYNMHNGYGVCNWFFITARDPKDITKLVELIPDAKTVLVTRDGIESHGNHADDEVNNYEYDLVFENNKGIKESGMDFAAALYELFGEDPNTLSSYPCMIDISNMVGVEFYSKIFYDCTITKCHAFYVYNSIAASAMNSKTNWLLDITVGVKTSNGMCYTLPLSDITGSLVDKDGKRFSEYFEEAWYKYTQNEKENQQ